MSDLLLDVHVEQPATDVAFVRFSGEHDLNTRDEIQRLLGELIESGRTVIVDFSDASSWTHPSCTCSGRRAARRLVAGRCSD